MVREPTEKQIEFAKSLAEDNDIDLDTIPFTFDEYRQFISKYAPPPEKPSAKQVAFAETIAENINFNLKTLPYTAKAYWEFIRDHRLDVPSICTGDSDGIADPTYINGIVDCYDFGITPWGDS